jgi:hypothetical protein
MSLLYLKYQSRKNLPFPRIQNLSKIIHLEYFFQKHNTNITLKDSFKTTGEENRPPMKFKNIRGSFYKNLKNLKIAGSRAEFVDFDF